MRAAVAGAAFGGTGMSMKVLLLHPEDTFPLHQCSANLWDLVVDLGRAPASTYERWTRRTGCEVLSLFRFAAEIDDLDRLRELLQLGMGLMVDSSGIDWWDLLCLFMASDLQQLMLVHRLSQELHGNCELFSSRPHPLARALQRLLGARLTIMESRFQSVIHRTRHYQHFFSNLDVAQLAQVLEDKFDGEHSIRRHFTRRSPNSGRPVILLPSAYVNVSRAALAYAATLPEHQFLLVVARSSGKLRSLPANVRSVSLSPYFVRGDKRETASLLDSWKNVRKHLVDRAEEFMIADAAGLLEQIPALLPWGIALRDAWGQLFESENVTACLSADDSNPPSSIPLLMAKKRGLPAIASHHGALDFTMAMKVNHADFYLVKSEMERDYLRRICHLAPEKIAMAAPASSKPLSLRRQTRRPAPWLVFFTEPYQSYGWRSDEVYRDLLPCLCSLAQTCRLQLVFKLHPFENIKAHRRMLCRLLPEHDHQIEVLAGPPSDQLWNNTRLALTVQSSTALECAALDIPVFLCAWLRDPYSGYVRQYAQYGVGHVLESPEQIADVPALLENQIEQSLQPQTKWQTSDSDNLARIFSGTYGLLTASNA
jgi:hypothetical protein